MEAVDSGAFAGDESIYSTCVPQQVSHWQESQETPRYKSEGAGEWSQGCRLRKDLRPSYLMSRRLFRQLQCSTCRSRVYNIVQHLLKSLPNKSLSWSGLREYQGLSEHLGFQSINATIPQGAIFCAVRDEKHRPNQHFAQQRSRSSSMKLGPDTTKVLLH